MLALEHAQEREPPGSLGMLYVITNTLHRNPCARLESWYVAPDISGAETIVVSAPAGAEIAKYVLIGAEFHYFCYLAQKYSIGKNVYLTIATPHKVPRSSDNHDNAVLQCTLTSRYHNEARELMYRSLSHRSHLILRNFFPK